MYIPTRWIDIAEVDKAVEEFLKTLGPEVVRVRYNIGEDWMGDPALYFRVVLSDRVAGDVHAFHETADSVRRSTFEQLKPLERWGLFPYVNFRSNAEQVQLNDPSWA